MKVTDETKHDLHTWLSFLTHFNGHAPFPPVQESRSTDLLFYTDASLTGYGIVCGPHWVAEKFPPVETFQHSMTWREFYPLLVSVHTFPHLLANRKVCFMTDNLRVYHILRSLTSLAPDIMSLTRPFVLQCLRHNISFTSSYLPSAENSLADPLSRQQFQTFRERAPLADQQRTPIPDNFKLC